MRQKLVSGGPEALGDFELLEMILFSAQERGDTKPLAERLIQRFGTFAAVLSASNEELLNVPQVGQVALAAIKLVKAAALVLIRTEAGMGTAPLMSNWDKLTDYLTAVMAHETREHFRVLFLDTRYRLIADEVLGRGTVNHVAVYPREVIKRGLELNATAMILVHNHPHGDPQPSNEDLVITRELCLVGEAMTIVVHDHIIVGRNGLLSFRAEGLI